MTITRPGTTGPPVLIYDGDCGFCTTCVRLVHRIAPEVDVVAYQFADLMALGTTASRAQRELLWAGTDGRVVGAERAVAGLLRAAGGVWRVPAALLAVPPVRWLAHGTYVLIARNRHRLPGGTPACALPPSQRPGPSPRPADAATAPASSPPPS